MWGVVLVKQGKGGAERGTDRSLAAMVIGRRRRVAASPAFVRFVSPDILPAWNIQAYLSQLSLSLFFTKQRTSNASATRARVNLRSVGTNHPVSP